MKESGFTGLPSTKGRIQHGKLIWNLYKDCKTKKHYYHTRSYNYHDKLIKKNIEVNDAFDLIKKYNDK